LFYNLIFFKKKLRGSLNNNLSSQLLADAFSTRFGDYVFNDEALDNVISQIMEEYSAYGPPPANNDAISSLTNFIIDAKSLGFTNLIIIKIFESLVF
jgi:methyltransferase-like protein